MRNLLDFILKYHFFFLFLLLEVLCVYLVVQNNYYQRSSFLNSSNSVASGVLSVSNNVSSYFYLREKNRKCTEENAMLRTQSPAAFFKHYAYDYQVIEDTIIKHRYKFTNSEVINSSVNRRNNYLTLDKGRLHGLNSGMGVFCNEGVIGIVNRVSDNFSTVISILHKKSSISAMLYKSSYKGAVSWDGYDYRYGKLSHIPNIVKIKKGDSVVTSGFSANFPKGILIGTIESFEKPEGDNFYDIKIKYSTDFKRISNVYVITNLLKDEQLELERLNEDEK